VRDCSHCALRIPPGVHDLNVGLGLLVEMHLLIADAISWSILLGSGKLSSLLRIRRLSAMLEPVVRAVAGLPRFF
jgi:hypothetical protein